MYLVKFLICVGGGNIIQNTNFSPRSILREPPNTGKFSCESPSAIFPTFGCFSSFLWMEDKANEKISFLY